LQYDAAVEAAEEAVEVFQASRQRVMGDNFQRLDARERLEAVNASLPRISKRMGLKPQDVGTSLLAHLHASVT
jgi:hypothetical protein